MLLIIGPSNSGKDYAAEYLRDKFGITYQSSSERALDIFLLDKLNNEYGYQFAGLTREEKIADAMAHKNKYPAVRKIWYKEIKAYNTPDKARLAREIMNSADCYCGMRDREELLACKEEGFFSTILWIEGVGATESSDSMNIEKSDADVCLVNRFDDEFKECLHSLGEWLFRVKTDPDWYLPRQEAAVKFPDVLGLDEIERSNVQYCP